MNFFKKIPLLILSCDAYSDLWPIYIQFLKKKWPEFSSKIYLLNETKNFTHKDYEIINYRQKYINETWSERLKNFLKQIDENYFLVVCDDYFPITKINHSEFLNCLNFVYQFNKNFGALYLVSSGMGKKIKNVKLFEKKKWTYKYYANFQAAIWNRECLSKILRNHETIWDFEKFSSIRLMFTKWNFYKISSYKNDKFEKIINYDPQKYGMTGGKWLPLSFDLFEKNKIDLNHMSLSNISFFYKKKNNMSLKLKIKKFLIKLPNLIKSLV